MTDVALTPSARRRSLAAVIASMGVTSLIYGLSTPLLALVLHAQGVDGTMIGLNTAAGSLAVFLVGPFAPRLMAAMGPANLMIAGVVASCVIFLLLPAFPDVYAWFPLRFILGAAGCLLWICGEAWVNEIADERSRGRVIGIYSTALSGGFALGPLILTITGTEGWTPFVVTTVIVALSGVPILIAMGSAPAMHGRASASLPAFLLLAPAAMMVNFVFAIADGALFPFVPIYGLRLGLEENMALYLVTIMGIGGIAMHYPMGWLADLMDRRLLLVMLVAGVICGLLLMPLLITVAGWSLLYMFVLGGFLGSLYSIGVTLLGQQFRGADLAAATTMFTAMWGLGAVVGPPIGGLGLEAAEPHGFPLAVALVFAAYLPLAIGSYLRGRRLSRP